MNAVKGIQAVLIKHPPAFVPAEGKYRNYVKQPSANCWQGRYSPRVDCKRVSYNVYGVTKEECEAKLAEKIKEVRVEMGNVKGDRFGHPPCNFAVIGKITAILFALCRRLFADNVVK